MFFFQYLRKLSYSLIVLTNFNKTMLKKQQIVFTRNYMKTFTEFLFVIN